MYSRPLALAVNLPFSFLQSLLLFFSWKPRAPQEIPLLYPSAFVRQQLSGRRNAFLHRQSAYCFFLLILFSFCSPQRLSLN